MIPFTRYCYRCSDRRRRGFQPYRRIGLIGISLLVLAGWMMPLAADAASPKPALKPALRIESTTHCGFNMLAHWHWHWQLQLPLAVFSQDAALPLDETVVDLEAQPRKGINFLTLLTRGGWFMLPLLILSILVVTIGVERFLALRREKIFPPELVDQISMLSAQKGGLDPRRVYQICQNNPSSATYILRTMLMKTGRPLSEMETAVSESAQREATRLSRTTSWLTLAAAIAPLIGLLGTVWGITQAFYDTTQLVVGQNRAEALAQGIYTALVTTMTGLLIAIPAAILSHFYENRIVQLLNEIEEMAYHLLPQLEKYEGQVRFTAGGLQPTNPNADSNAEDSQTPSASDPQLSGSESEPDSKLDSIQPSRIKEKFGQAGSLAVPTPEKFFRPNSE